MYALINQYNIVNHLVDTHSEAVSSGYKYINLDTHSEVPLVGMRFNPEGDQFGDPNPEKLRDLRNKLLLHSDWRVVADYPNSDQPDWLAYRAKLRDVPQDYPDVSTAIFPLSPDEEK